MNPNISIRLAQLDDLRAINAIYNHYVVNTAVTFDTRPFEPHERRAWFEEHCPDKDGKYRMIVAVLDGRVVGYAASSRFRARPAYETTIETSIYCHTDAVGCGIGSRLYTHLFELLRGQDLHRVVAGTTLPNPASVALHEKMGFKRIGVYSEVGRKFGKYWDVAWFEREL